MKELEALKAWGNLEGGESWMRSSTRKHWRGFSSPPVQGLELASCILTFRVCESCILQGAHVLLDSHQIIDGILEAEQGSDSIGTT